MLCTAVSVRPAPQHGDKIKAGKRESPAAHHCVLTGREGSCPAQTYLQTGFQPKVRRSEANSYPGHPDCPRGSPGWEQTPRDEQRASLGEQTSLVLAPDHMLTEPYRTQAGCHWNTPDLPWEADESKAAWGQSHPLPAGLSVADRYCSRPKRAPAQSFESPAEVQLFFPCTKHFLIYFQFPPAQQHCATCKSGVENAPLPETFGNGYFTTTRRERKDTETRPGLGLGAISGLGGKESTNGSETPQSGFLQDLYISN